MDNQIQGFQMSPQQERLWSLGVRSGDSPHRVEASIKIKGELEVGTLNEAISRVVARNEILRTTFCKLPGLGFPVQVIGEPREVVCEEHDLRGFSAESVQSVRSRLRTECFDVERGPLVRFVLARVTDTEAILFISASALVSDSTGLRNVACEIQSAYIGGTKDGEDPIQYNVISQWQNEVIASEDAEAGREYWRQTKSPTLVTEESSAFTPREICFEWSSVGGAGLDDLCRRYGTTLPELLLGAWQTLLARHKGMSSVAVAACFDGRTDEELMAALGPLSRFLPLMVAIDGDQSMREVTSGVMQGFREASEWQECFAWEDLVGAREGGVKQSFFPYAFDFLPEAEMLSYGGTVFELADIWSCIDRFHLKLACRRHGTDLQLRLEYDGSRYGRQEVERLAAGYGALLSSLSGTSEAPICALDVLGADERRRLLVELNETSMDLEGARALHELVEEQAAENPQGVALIFGGEEMTYAALDGRANQLAHYLRGLDVSTECRVAICVERSPEMVVGILGILKAGAAYVPLDPSYPKDRLAFMLEDSGASVLVTQWHLEGLLPQVAVPVVRIDGDEARAIGRQSRETPKVFVDSAQAAYVIYTSGSTGRPKGVTVSHGAIRNRLLWMQATIPLGRKDRLLQKTSISFDASVWEIFVPLLAGAQVILAEPGGHRDASYLVKTVIEEGVTVLQLVPSMVPVFLDEPDVGQCRGLRRVFCGGEALPAELVNRFYETLSADLHNLYGPTETSIDATHWRAEKVVTGAVAPIGRPLANARVYLVDHRLRPVPFGMPGELCVAGTGLARGYHERPGGSAERFVPDPFGERESGRLYRTGDLARYRSDDTLEYLGRIDQQVKIRGFRIELGEIEAVLNRLPGVKSTAVAVKEDARSEPRLVAYVVPDEKSKVVREEDLYSLPNGMAIAHLNRGESDWLYKEVFEDESYLMNGVTLEDGDRIFDVGANIGLFSLFASQRVRDARIFAFEPAPPTFEKLQINAALHARGARVFNYGLSDAEKTADFVFYRGMSASSGLYADTEVDEQVTKAFLGNQSAAVYADELVEGKFEAEVFTCQFRTISSVIAEFGVDRIDFLKLDVEKSEMDVLRGIAAEDWPKIKQMAMEVHDIDGRLAEITSLLADRGFSVSVDEVTLLENTGLYNLFAVHPSRREGRARAQSAPRTDVIQVGSPVLAVSQLSRSLAEELPDYMVPSIFVMLDELPVTSSGKLDRKALPTPDFERRELQDKYVAPRNAVEEVLSELFAELLGLERVGINDNFFDIGGHSLMATQAISRVRKIFQIKVPLAAFFERATVADVAECLRQHESKEGNCERAAQLMLKLGALDTEELEKSFATKELVGGTIQ